MGFPGARNNGRPMSENTLAVAMRTIGIPKDTMSVHGFRAMARTLLDEELGFPPHLIEHQLAHRVSDPLGTAYNRTKHLFSFIKRLFQSVPLSSSSAQAQRVAGSGESVSETLRVVLGGCWMSSDTVSLDDQVR